MVSHCFGPSQLHSMTLAFCSLGEGHQLWDLNGTFIYDAMIHVDYQNQPITFREEMICQLNFE